LTPPRDTQGWSRPLTASAASAAIAVPALSTRRSPEKTSPARISACALARLSARPRSTSSWSTRRFAVGGL